MKKPKTKTKTRPSFKILIPSKTEEIEEIFVHDNFVGTYQRSLEEMKDQVSELRDNDEFDPEMWCDELSQYEFVIEQIRRDIEETYEYEMNFLKEVSDRIHSKYPDPSPVHGPVITDETRNKVKELTLKGKSGKVIAKRLGISLPSVQNIKKSLGLFMSRTV